MSTPRPVLGDATNTVDNTHTPEPFKSRHSLKNTPANTKSPHPHNSNTLSDIKLIHSPNHITSPHALPIADLLADSDDDENQYVPSADASGNVSLTFSDEGNKRESLALTQELATSLLQQLADVNPVGVAETQAAMSDEQDDDDDGGDDEVVDDSEQHGGNDEPSNYHDLYGSQFGTGVIESLLTVPDADANNKSFLLDATFQPTDQQRKQYMRQIEAQLELSDFKVSLNDMTIRAMIERDNAIATIDELTEKTGQYRAALQKIHDMYEVKSNRLTHEITQAEQLAAENQLLYSENSKLCDDVNSVSATLCRLENEYNTVCSNYEQLLPTYEKECNLRKTLRASNKQLTTDNETLQKRITALETSSVDAGQVIELTSQIAMRDSTIEQMQQTIDTMINSNISSSKRLSMCSSETQDDAAQQLINALESELTSMATVVEVSHAAQLAAQAELKAVAAELTASKQRMETAETENVKLQDDVKRIWSSNNVDTTQLESYKQQYTDAVQRYNVLYGQYEQMQQVVTAMESVQAAQQTVDAHLTDRTERVGVKYNELAAKLEYAQCELAELQLTHDSVCTDMTESMNTVEALNGTVSAVKQQLADLDTQCVTLMVNNVVTATVQSVVANCLTADKAALTNALQSVTNERDSLVEQCEHLTIEYSAVHDLHTAQTQQTNVLASQVEQLIKDKATLIESVEMQTYEQQELQAQYDNEHATHAAQTAVLNAQISDLTAQRDTVAEQLSGAEVRMAALEAHNSKLNTKLAETAEQSTADLQAVQQHLTAVKSELTQSQQSVSELTATLTTIQAALTAATGEMQQLKAQSIELQQASKAAQGDAELHRQTIVGLNNQAMHSANDLSVVQSDLAALKAEHTVMTQKYGSVKTELKQCQSQLQQATDECSALQSHVSRQSVQQSGQSVNASRLNSVQNELDALQSEYVVSQTRLAQCEACMLSKQEQIDALTEVVNSKCTDCDSIHPRGQQCSVKWAFEQLNAVTIELQQCRTQLTDVTSERDQIIQHVDTLSHATHGLASKADLAELVHRCDALAHQNAQLSGKLVAFDDNHRSLCEKSEMLTYVTDALRKALALMQRSKLAIVRYRESDVDGAGDLEQCVGDITKYYERNQILLNSCVA